MEKNGAVCACWIIDGTGSLYSCNQYIYFTCDYGLDIGQQKLEKTVAMGSSDTYWNDFIQYPLVGNLSVSCGF